MNLIESHGGWYSGYANSPCRRRTALPLRNMMEQAYWTLQISAGMLHEQWSRCGDRPFARQGGKRRVRDEEPDGDRHLFVRHGSGRKQIGGLQLLSRIRTRNGRRISATTFAKWQNYVYSFAANSQVAGATTIQSHSKPPFSIPAVTRISLIWLSPITSITSFSGRRSTAIQRITMNARPRQASKTWTSRASVIYDGVCLAPRRRLTATS